MVLKIINATEAKVGTNIIVDGHPCVVKKIDISKTGKHGHAKARIEAVGLITGNKKVFVVPGHDRLEVPMVDKRKGQVLSKSEGKASVMDMESFETLDIDCPEKEVCDSLEESGNCEYWDIEGTKIIKRKL
ncbi:translation initiation factor IF-5A [archaeon]|jgi:translation initiation factor 5A|nr:translation initiation factor IF-5A [archaeon]MBT4373208.1 translation initiation factor IF-5A [archaeon]MBT4531553.1 translation initiation factor IF-5A [archaeon]MBT7001269.1 translation initiation factor IF-5A [archaeon]MBT7282245.1 translation initiation factor IF-5A [archaeon]